MNLRSMMCSRRPAHLKTLHGLFLKSSLSLYSGCTSLTDHKVHAKYLKFIEKNVKKEKKNRQITAALKVNFGMAFLMVMFLFANSDNRWRFDRRFSLWIKDGCFLIIEDSVNQLKNYQIRFLCQNQLQECKIKRYW